MIYGTIHRTLWNKTRKDTKIKLYKLMATPDLTYGVETWRWLEMISEEYKQVKWSSWEKPKVTPLSLIHI